MSSDGSFWDKLNAAVNTGQSVQVTLSPGAEIRPSRRSPGRPRIRGVIPFGHYAGYDHECGGRPRCQAEGCSKFLKKDQALGCCQEHTDAVVKRAERLLARKDAKCDD